MHSTALISRLACISLLGLFSTVSAHGGDNGGEHEGHNDAAPKDASEYPPSYFAHTEHVGLIYAHIAVMILAWVFVLPIAVMLSLARSRHTIVIQYVFMASNMLGLVLGCIYNSKTPDLYPGNAHHKIGWIATWVAIAQILINTVGWIGGRLRGVWDQRSSESQAFRLAPTDVSPERQASAYGDDNNQFQFRGPYRLSDDSGQGTEPHTESLGSDSTLSLDDPPKEEEEDCDDDMEDVPLHSSTKKNIISLHAARIISSRIWTYVVLGYRVIDRIILPLGFVGLTTGIVTFGRFFEGDEIFSGLAHWIKGGIFFWFGLLTLGRWASSFADLGWAWNVRPKRGSQKWRPSAEFVESALIFAYGSTNVFLEHLGGWGGEWSAQDLEHVSITILFIGGGLCGMLVESTRIRDLLNTTVVVAEPRYPYVVEEGEKLQPPNTYEFSLNPMPALVILLLGIMMSSHTQASMISSMIHKQWGNLLLGASFARAFTYVLMFLKPPTSILPSRPPTELLTAFGLIAGGIIFMASSSDTVKGIIHYELDAMFVYTVTMGLVGMLMAWEVVVLAVKGWAVRRERRAQSHRM
ncbi:hypothetical protein G7046_g366 [Stylonectria norvegica]|nr:hypothetical protein G7046_g366 [Stylonectria norvegica]